jgi:replicative DNA helicase
MDGAERSLPILLHGDLYPKGVFLPNGQDPDDFIKKFGVEKFNNLPELSAFDWVLNKFTKDNENERYKEIVISLIMIEGNFLKREKLIKKMSESSDFTQKAILQEIEKYSTQKDAITSVKEVIEAKESLINDVNDFEEKVWKRTTELLGIDTGWPLFNKIFDGLQEGFYIVAGRTNIGKSAFNISLVYNLLNLNQDNIYILYFNIDDSNYKCIGRMISIDSRIPINWIKNPKFKIKLNDALSEEQKTDLLNRRDLSINRVKSMTQSLSFKNVGNVEEVEKIIKIYNSIAESERKKLIVFVDKVHNLGSYKKLQKRELTDHVSVVLKSLVNAYDIPIIGSLEVTKSSIMTRPTEADIKETQKLEDDSDATILLYNAHKVDPNTQFIFTENGVTYPIVEAIVPKNKLNDLSGYDTKVFFKMYPHLSCLEECSEEDQRRFNSIAP